MPREPGFDLAQFDAVAVDLDLIIRPTEKLDIAISQQPRQIAGPI